MLFRSDSVGLQYQEVHLRENWFHVKLVLEAHPQELKLLEDALMLGLKFQPRTPEFQRARQQALEGLERCGFPFNKAAKNDFSRRYLEAKKEAQRILTDLFSAKH